MKQIIIIIAGLLCPSLLFGNYFFNIIDGDDELSNNKVRAILQDSRGFMWIGTSNQLNRYDGISIKTFDCYDPITGKREKDIAALAEDSNQRLWIGTGIGVFIYDPFTDGFTFFDKKASDGIQIESWISDVQADKDNNIWIAVPGQGVFRYNTQSDSLHHYLLGDNYFGNRGLSVLCICVENSGTVWVGTRKEGLFLYNNVSDTFTQQLGCTGKDSLKGNNIFKVCEYGKYLVIGLHEGTLKTFNKQSKELEDTYISSNHYDIVRAVQSFNNKDLWVGTEAGLCIVNETNKTTIRIEQDLMNRFSLSDNKISSIYCDKENGIWVGTFFGGVCHLPNQQAAFAKYVPLSRKSSINSKQIKEIQEDRSGNIWIGTENAGLNIFNPDTKEFKQLEVLLNRKNVDLNVTGFYVDNDKVWIGYFQSGLDVVDLSTFRSTFYSGKQIGTNEECIFSFFKDRKGNMWLGTLWSLYFAPSGRMNFEEVESMRGNCVYDIIEDKEGFIWVATMGQGVYQYNPDSKELKRFYYQENDSSSISSNAVSSITEDYCGQLWFATDGGGLCVFNKVTQQFRTYGIKQGLPDNTTYKVLEDKDRNLWFGTTKGLVRFNPQTEEVKVYTKDDKLSGNQFGYKSALKTSSECFYFGGSEGLVAFEPDHIQTNDYIPPVFITKMTVSNKEVNPDGQKVTLHHNQSTVGFEFAALSYTAPQANRYAYKMENLDNDWIYTNNNHSASYAKLPSGNYIFRVKGSNNDGLWNEKGAFIEITVLSPWWLSVWAFIAYFLFVSGAVYYWICWYKQKQERRNREKQYLFETQKEKEAYRSKLDFFTNIAHEIRTPMTLIQAPLESLLNRDIKDSGVCRDLSVMGQNVNQLLGLINQLLDFRKVDNNKYLPNYTRINVNELIEDCTAQFDFMIRQKKKKFQIQLPEKPVFAIADKDGLTKIFNNLFSNAIKYSRSYVDIKLEQISDCFLVHTKNDGEVIPPELKEKIFEPFFQLKKDSNTPSSSGIGLSIARSYAEFQNGTLDVDSNAEFTAFTLKLPLEQREYSPVEDASYLIEESEPKDEKSHVYTVLFVEDNLEMLSFIAEKLEDLFKVKKATDGIKALEILESQHIDIILSDVMMDGMDGLELCQRVKKDMNYSHIPFILLTAKCDLNSKIQGLEAGADAYIEKPFSFNFLTTQLTALLSNRMRERNAFIQNPVLAIQQTGLNKADELFLNKITEITHENITDYNFGVEKLADILAMSRSNLHRKIKVISGLSPTDFIRLVRMKKATELIQSGEHRIGDVGFMVGINSFSYFSRLFHKHFGMTPKEFEKQSKTDANQKSK